MQLTFEAKTMREIFEQIEETLEDNTSHGNQELRFEIERMGSLVTEHQKSNDEMISRCKAKDLRIVQLEEMLAHAVGVKALELNKPKSNRRKPVEGKDYRNMSPGELLAEQYRKPKDDRSENLL